MDTAGFVYQTNRGAVIKSDSKTGELVQRYPLKKIQGTYDSMVTPDGRYWAGGTTTSNIVGLLDMKTGQAWEVETPTLQSNPARGGFDPEGNAWIGGRGGALIKMDGKTHRVTEYYPPVAYETFYEAMPDKNGEIWAGGLQSGRFWRFNPKTERWTAYMMPEPYAHDRRTWIDNSTTPVTVWYVDHNGYMVRIQPLD
jgi:streptogramin lyase